MVGESVVGRQEEVRRGLERCAVRGAMEHVVGEGVEGGEEHRQT